VAQDKQVPKSLEAKLKRGRDRMMAGSAARKEAMEFYRGNHYAFVSQSGQLQYQATANSWTRGTGKPSHRVRNTRNLIYDIVLHEVSQSTQRVPSYQVSPSTTDPEDIGAARLAEKVALYGYDAWRVRNATVKAVLYAIVQGEGFVWPYFDNQIGTPLADDVATGDICLRVYGGNEVYWEAGCRFEDSPWHAIEHARPLEAVKADPRYDGGELTADAASNDASQRNKAASQMVIVTDYLELPTPQNPTGSWETLANDRVIYDPTDYPCTDGEGKPTHEPVINRLSYAVDPDSERDLGLVGQLLDAQRTYNDAGNKMSEWKNLALMPQILAPTGAITTPLTDEPGAIVNYMPSFGFKPEWRPTPPVPRELFEMQERAEQELYRIAAQNDIPTQVESGKGIQALLERDDSRRADFRMGLADFHSRLMRHCLYLAQKHYSEPRLLKIKGRFGPETISDFKGSDLKSQVDVTVLPGSLEPKTKEALEQKVMNYATLGWISPEAAMAAINGGTAEKLIESYELDVARANLVIQKLKAGPDVFFAIPPRFDSRVGREVEGWFPRPFDNIGVHMAIFSDWMKTEDYDMAAPEIQEAAALYYETCEQLKAEEAAKAAAEQTLQAESLGMSNAAKPQGPTPLPSQAKEQRSA
jgi:hypothetical protein